MSENKIYGVDLNSEVTPLMVRDAIVECFYNAHCADSALEDDDSKSVNKYCAELVKGAFTNTGGDFENPTKESIVKVLGQLAEFSKNFRNPEVIKKHYNEIMQLVERL